MANQTPTPRQRTHPTTTTTSSRGGWCGKGSHERNIGTIDCGIDPKGNMVGAEGGRGEMLRKIIASATTLQQNPQHELHAQLHALLIHIGWQTKLQHHAREITQQQPQAEGGVAKVTLERLVVDLIPRGKALVPREVKEEMLRKIIAATAADN
mmetsp:Transcript_26307/g.55532  ORF Transcript_26307/g.55532 Transcript_26307/m.55532 type:complete len:153 (+) Transcript_26307:594-1052(+)